MSAQEKWDKRYLNADVDSASPVDVLSENTHLLPNSGRVLDYACGLGGNAFLMARLGLETSAWDISTIAIDKILQKAQSEKLSIDASVEDLDTVDLFPETFDVIVVSRYLQRTKIPNLISALTVGGVLFYQTFTQEKTQGSGPSSSDFLLKQNELLHLCEGLRVLSFKDEGKVGDISNGLRNESWIVAVKEVGL